MFGSINSFKTVIATLNRHVSIREYDDKTVSQKLLEKILTSARRSPSSSNLQAYTFVVIRDQKVKRELAVLAGNQKHVETCPVFIAVCADISRLTTACEMHNKQLAKNLETTLIATVDAALAGMALSLAAESEGLGTVMIGGMRNHPEQVKNLLGFPKGVYVVFGLCIGWPAHVPLQKPRLAEMINIHYEKYNNAIDAEDLKAYDTALARHYEKEKKSTPAAAWTGIIAKRYSEPHRTKLRKTLESMGFDFS